MTEQSKEITKKIKITHCIWLREDLRVQNHEGFRQAQENYPDESCIAVYIFTPETWLAHERSPSQIYFILENLKLISEQLKNLNIALKILNLKTFEQIPEALLNFCQIYAIQNIYAARNYGFDELNRDKNCVDLLKKFNIKINFRNDFVFFAPHKILKPDGQPYKVFTAYKKAWIQKILETQVKFLVNQQSVEPVKKQKDLGAGVFSDAIPSELPEFPAPENKAYKKWVLSEQELVHKFKDFIQNDLKSYAQNRNFPAVNKNSQLSPYLAIGVIGIGQVLNLLMQERSCGNFLDLLAQEGVEVFISELIWRDFYQMILFNFPRVSKHQPYLLETTQIHWSQDQNLFKSWCEGQTGFPIIDASMRCLNQTGFLHNRLRMIVAMFLTKILWIDWRWGEAYFMRNLIDGELAANNGGWQWCASTGTDSVPYFRIFSPVLQSQKFDPEGRFIREYLPELKNLNSKDIHDPDLSTRQKCAYPVPIVDYSAQRKWAIESFKKLKYKI